MNRWFGRGVLALLGVFVVGGIVGLAAGGGVASWAHHTSQAEFCVTCHYAQWPQESYQELAHYTNASGVRADCGDCHEVHHPWWKMLWQKAAYGARHTISHWQGELSTREEYEARRLEMAERVWRHLEETDSEFCQNCHTWEAMALSAQEGPAQGAHRMGEQRGMTCIACHKGIGHGIEPPDNGGGGETATRPARPAAGEEGSRG